MKYLAAGKSSEMEFVDDVNRETLGEVLIELQKSRTANERATELLAV